ncbi:PIN domain-containing protein [Candidatus Dependentiae bacterium]|nr:PIN domain-containing protein [Candidatus Dependentiae bacterium]
MYVYDTDTISNTMKKKPSDRLLKKLRTVPQNMQFTTSVNIAEIYFGIYNSSNSDILLKAYKERIFPYLSILPFDTASAEIYGRLKAQMNRKGISVSEPDLRIASITIQNNFTLITGNTGHFSLISGLKYEDWIKPKL